MKNRVSFHGEAFTMNPMSITNALAKMGSITRAIDIHTAVGEHGGAYLFFDRPKKLTEHCYATDHRCARMVIGSCDREQEFGNWIDSLTRHRFYNMADWLYSMIPEVNIRVLGYTLLPSEENRCSAREYVMRDCDKPYVWVTINKSGSVVLHRVAPTYKSGSGNWFGLGSTVNDRVHLGNVANSKSIMNADRYIRKYEKEKFLRLLDKLAGYPHHKIFQIGKMPLHPTTTQQMQVWSMINDFNNKHVYMAASPNGSVYMYSQQPEWSPMVNDWMMNSGGRILIATIQGSPRGSRDTLRRFECSEVRTAVRRASHYSAHHPEAEESQSLSEETVITVVSTPEAKEEPLMPELDTSRKVAADAGQEKPSLMTKLRLASEVGELCERNGMSLEEFVEFLQKVKTLNN